MFSFKNIKNLFSIQHLLKQEIHKEQNFVKYDSFITAKAECCLKFRELLLAKYLEIKYTNFN